MTFHALGAAGVQPSRNLETFETPANVQTVRLDYDEMTSLCPVTQQPDMARVIVNYAPKTRCLESKSLKLYFQTYRNAGVFCEHLAGQIAHDLEQVLEPRWIIVRVIQKRRGGIEITTTARLP